MNVHTISYACTSYMSLVHALEKDELLFKRLWFFLFVILSVKVIKILLMHYVNQLKVPIGLGTDSNRTPNLK